MIGKPVPKEEFIKLLEEEKRKEEFVKVLDEELRALKTGECLLYETGKGNESVLRLSLALYLPGKLTAIERPGKVYVYKKC